MVFLKLKIIFLIIIHFCCFSLGEQQLTPGEFLGYFSIAAGINSLIFSLSNTLFAIKRINQNRKKKRGFKEGISDSLNRSKELKLKNLVGNHLAIDSINNREQFKLNQELDKNKTNVSQLIAQSCKLAEVEMIKNESVIVSSKINFTEQSHLGNSSEIVGKILLFQNSSNIKNVNDTRVNEIAFNNNLTRKFRGLVIE